MYLNILCYGRARREGLDRRTLVFSIPSLNLFVFTLLHFAFKDTSTLRLVKSGHFEYLRRVQPRIRAPPHHRDPLAHPLRVMSVIEEW